MEGELDIVAAATELAYADQLVGNSFPQMPGFVVDRVFDDLWDNTGFYAVGFINVDAAVVIIAIRGSQDRLDIVTDIDLGLGQFEANQVPIIDYIGSKVLANRIIVCGHSLGGGLSQYIGYAAAKTYSAFQDKLCVHTHNGFGGLAGIARLHGSFEPEVVAGVMFRNFRHPEDPVSRIGGQVGGISNLARSETGGLLFVHSNERFLRAGAPASPLEGALKAVDEMFDIGVAIETLGPELSALVKRIVTSDEAMQAVSEIPGLLARVPAAQRGPLIALATELLPFRRLVQRFRSPTSRGKPSGS